MQSADRNWAIGKNNELLVRVPEDMKFFRRMTTGKVVVMGRKTLESFPNHAPLPNRVNVVLTRDRSYQKEGVVLVHDMEELGEELKKYPDGDVFVIGGESIYRQLWTTATRRTLPAGISPTTRTPIFRIWMSAMTGDWRRRAKSRPVSI